MAIAQRTVGEPVTQPKTFLFIVGPHRSELHAVVGLARRLQRRGHDVHFLTGVVDATIADVGFPSHHASWLFGVSKVQVMTEPRTRRAKVIAGWAREAETGAARILAEIRPDAVLFQPFLLHLYPFFWKSGVHSAVLSTRPLLTPDPWVPPYTSRRIPDRSIVGRTAIAYDWLLRKLDYAWYRTTCATKELLFGMSRRSHLVGASKATGFPLRLEEQSRAFWMDVKFRSVPELVLYPQEFDFARKGKIPQGTSYIGPCVDSERLKQELALPAGNGPLIVCNLGTVSEFTPITRQLYQNIIEAVEREPTWRLILSTGAHESATALRVNPRDTERIHVRGWVPIVAALSKADVLVNHAGGNSTKEALTFGVPILAFPEHTDQPGISARIAHHGVGLVGERRDASADWIHETISALLHNTRYRQRSSSFQDLFSQYDRSSVAETVLESVANGSGR